MDLLRSAKYVVEHFISQMKVFTAIHVSYRKYIKNGHLAAICYSWSKSAQDSGAFERTVRILYAEDELENSFLGSVENRSDSRHTEKVITQNVFNLIWTWSRCDRCTQIIKFLIGTEVFYVSSEQFQVLFMTWTTHGTQGKGISDTTGMRNIFRFLVGWRGFTLENTRGQTILIIRN